MRVLLAHNYYGASAPSGENQVFELERDLLERRGHQVGTLVRHSDDVRNRGPWRLLVAALATPWNLRTSGCVRRALDEFRPEVVHVHNTFPLLSPAIFSAIGPRAARVLTLHNYRLFCPAAVPQRRGRPCTECIDRHSVLPALWWGCYRNSRLATLPLAGSVALHRHLRTWHRHVDAFIALSAFQRDLMVKAGLPAPSVFVKPNFYPGQPPVVPWSSRGDYAVFAGRISQEKGVTSLIDAWLAWGESAPPLHVVGDGPLYTEIQARVAARGNRRITFLGHLPERDAQAEIASARLLLLPSTWFEGFPMVIREAFAFGTPVAVSAIGPLPQIVEHGRIGILFKPGDSTSLANAVRAAWSNDPRMRRMSELARAEFEAKYAEEANYRTLMEIYARALSTHERGRGRHAR